MNYVKSDPSQTTADPPKPLVLDDPPEYKAGVLIKVPTIDEEEPYNMEPRTLMKLVADDILGDPKVTGANFECTIFVKPTIWTKVPKGSKPSDMRTVKFTLSFKLKDIRIFAHDTDCPDKPFDFTRSFRTDDVI